MKKIKKTLSAIIILCLILCHVVIPTSAEINDKEYDENEPGNDYYESAGVLQKDFTINGSLTKNTNDLDWYVFNLHETAKVRIFCFSDFEDLIGGIFDSSGNEVLYTLIEDEYEEYFIDDIVVTLPAGEYYILLCDRYSYSYYENNYILYFNYEDPEPTLEYIDGEWRCVVGDYYSNMTGLVNYNGKTYYVIDGVWSNQIADKLYKIDGKWYYIVDGKLSNKTTLVKYNGKWYYVKNGVKNTSTTIVKYNGKWYYVEKGIKKTATKLVKYKGKYYYVKDGKVSFTTGVKKVSGKYYYIKDGKWSKSTTLYKKDGKYYAVKSGKWYKSKAIIKYNGKKYYVNKGYAQTKYSGKVKIGSKTYTVKKGIIK